MGLFFFLVRSFSSILTEWKLNNLCLCQMNLLLNKDRHFLVWDRKLALIFFLALMHEHHFTCQLSSFHLSPGCFSPLVFFFGIIQASQVVEKLLNLRKPDVQQQWSKKRSCFPGGTHKYTHPQTQTCTTLFPAPYCAFFLLQTSTRLFIHCGSKH